MSIKDFEEEYAARSGVSVEWLHENGYSVAPCHCGEPNCQGFQITHGASFDILEHPK
jgi:hypothetical protein